MVTVQRYRNRSCNYRNRSCNYRNRSCNYRNRSCNYRNRSCNYRNRSASESAARTDSDGPGRNSNGGSACCNGAAPLPLPLQHRCNTARRRRNAAAAAATHHWRCGPLSWGGCNNGPLLHSPQHRADPTQPSVSVTADDSESGSLLPRFRGGASQQRCGGSATAVWRERSSGVAAAPQPASTHS